MEKTYRAVKYMRTSCLDDEMQYRNSIVNQSKIIDVYLLAHPEIILVSEQLDDGYSGLFYDRPAFNKIIADVEAGHVNCIIVKDLSRIGRDYIETGRYLRDFFPAYGVRLICVNDNIDSVLFDGFEKTIALIKSIFSERYSYDVSVKTRSSLDAKRRQGKYVGAIPIYGYQKSPGDKNRLVPDPKTSTVVQSIFDMKLQGISAAKIATDLNDSGTPSPLAYKRNQGVVCPTGGFSDKNNAKWSATTVLRILGDENYTGTLVQGRQRSLNYKTKILLDVDEKDWIRVKNAHPLIIPKMDFDAAQRVMALDTRTAPGRQKVHIFSGMLICGCCGSYMTRKTVKNKGKQFVYYYCSTGKESGCHSHSMISERELLDSVTYKVKERIDSVGELNAVFPKYQLNQIHRDEYIQQIAVCDEKMHELCNFRSHLNDSLLSGIINDCEYRAFQDFYNQEITRLDNEIVTLWRKLSFPEDSTSNDSEWMQYFLQFTNQKELDRQAVVKLIHSVNIVSKEKITVNFICQPEYEQAVRYSVLGGRING